jgi:hypothetical protein
LISCDFFLFGHSKKELEGRNCRSENQMISAVRIIFMRPPETGSDRKSQIIDCEQNTIVWLDISCSFLCYDYRPKASQQAKIARYRKDFWTTIYNPKTDDETF